MTDTPDRDFATHPLTELEKAYLTIAQFDLDLYALRSKAACVLHSRRKLTSSQSAVLTSFLDDLEQEVVKPAPKWPTKS